MIAPGVLHEDERFELVGGDVVMTAAKGVAHERIKSALTGAISRALPHDLTIDVEATLRLNDMTMLEPDVAVFPRDVFRESTTFARLEPGEARPVVEIAASRLAHDKGLEARPYARHGVRGARSAGCAHDARAAGLFDSSRRDRLRADSWTGDAVPRVR